MDLKTFEKQMILIIHISNKHYNFSKSKTHNGTRSLHKYSALYFFSPKYLLILLGIIDIICTIILAVISGILYTFKKKKKTELSNKLTLMQ